MAKETYKRKGTLSLILHSSESKNVVIRRHIQKLFDDRIQRQVHTLKYEIYKDAN